MLGRTAFSGLVPVLVVSADPELETIALIAALRRPIEDSVVAHQELDPATPGRVGVVDSPLVQDEGAEALALRQVADDIGTAVSRIAGGDWRALPHEPFDPSPRPFLLAPPDDVAV